MPTEWTDLDTAYETRPELAATPEGVARLYLRDPRGDGAALRRLDGGYAVALGKGRGDVWLYQEFRAGTWEAAFSVGERLAWAVRGWAFSLPRDTALRADMIKALYGVPETRRRIRYNLPSALTKGRRLTIGAVARKMRDGELQRPDCTLITDIGDWTRDGMDYLSIAPANCAYCGVAALCGLGSDGLPHCRGEQCAATAEWEHINRKEDDDDRAVAYGQF